MQLFSQLLLLPVHYFSQSLPRIKNWSRNDENADMQILANCAITTNLANVGGLIDCKKVLLSQVKKNCKKIQIIKSKFLQFKNVTCEANTPNQNLPLLKSAINTT